METSIEVPKVEGVDVELGMRRNPVKRTWKGREVGESALSTKPLNEHFEYFELEN